MNISFKPYITRFSRQKRGKTADKATFQTGIHDARLTSKNQSAALKRLFERSLTCSFSFKVDCPKGGRI